MSPRAACRLEILGFSDVYDYAASKADWIAAGRPTEGDVGRIGAASVADRQVLTCGPDETGAAVAARLRTAGSDTAIVLGHDRVVLGRLRLGRFDESDGRAAIDAMEEGPATVRADADLHDLLARMERRDVVQVVVTTPQGELIGLLRRDRRDRPRARLP